MKGRTILILLVCTIALAGFIWLQNNLRMNSYQHETERLQLFGLNIDTLNRFKVQSTNNVLLECVFNNGVWMTGAAGENLGRADLAMFQRMIAAFNILAKGTTITANQLKVRGLDFSEYGFDNPVARIYATDNTGTHTWIVGNQSPLGKLVYVRYVGDNNIYTTSSILLDLLPVRSDQLRDRSIFAGITGVRRLEVRGGEGLMELVKDPELGWEIQQPVESKADQVKINSFVNTLYKFRIENFIAEKVSDYAVYGLLGNVNQVSLGGSDGSSRTLFIGDEVPNKPDFIYARRADETSVFTIKKEVRELLRFNLDDFRDRQLLQIPLKEINAITIQHGPETLEMIQQPKDHWQIINPVRWLADNDMEQSLLQVWYGAVIADFFDDNQPEGAAFANQSPDWIFSFQGINGQTNRFEVLPQDPTYKAILVRRDNEQATYRVSIEPIPNNLIDPLLYKHKEALSLDKNKIEKITQIWAENEEQTIVRKGDQFVASGVTDVEMTVNTDNINQLKNQLTNLSALKYVAYNPSSLDPYGLNAPFLKVQMSLSDAADQLGYVILLGNKAPDGYYAMIQGRDVVFVLSNDIVARLKADLVVRMAPLSESK